MKKEYKKPEMMSIEMNLDEHIVASGSQTTCSQTYINNTNLIEGCTRLVVVPDGGIY